MELKFQRDLDFQLTAINSTIDLFQSQKFTQEDFIIIPENGIIPNVLNLTQKQVLENLNEIQQRNNISPIDKLDGMNFSVEMETGTGKTYVYLRTIFELNKNYGFKKFIIIIPSVAIREGVLKSLKITEKHFKEIYENISYSYYEYDSKKINLVRQFARGNKVEIMVMTLDSFNKDTNIMNQERDTLYGQKPIDLVSKTKPILILDEPQNMESEIAKQALANLDPLFTLRYSATHRNYYNLIYRLTPVDAYNKHLVKRIEVASVIKEGDFNTAFIKCTEIKADAKGIKAKLEVNKKVKNGFKVSQIIVNGGDDLQIKTQSDEYVGFIIAEINAKYNFVKFSNGVTINLGEEQGGDRTDLMKIQIEQTIEEHFRKYRILKKMGIKTLSLFFIDRVDNYLSKDGIIRKFFEESFNQLKKQFDDFKDIDVKTVHSGYFSKMKNEKSMEQDKDTFDLIMRDKERLLSFDEPIQFIFSHSALREGWDNPNVFNICTLNQSISNIRKRQEIGRGMRLPVNQQGTRIIDEYNVLTVIANENYAEFASKLQKEYEDEYGTGSAPKITNARNRTTLKLKKGYQLNPEFKELWKRVAKRTKYAIQIDTNDLIKQCISKINSEISIDSIKVKIETVALSLDREMKVVTTFKGYGHEFIDKNYSIPNIIEHISNETKLTRETVVNIITEIKNLDLIFKDPQEFVASATLIIKEKLADFLVNGIKYLEINDWYKMELFKDIETYQDMIIPVDHSIYDGIIWDSDVEKNFASTLNEMPNVKLFIKLPDWFVIETPIGEYNPDWAIVMDDVDQHGNIRERLYFITETKGTTNLDELRPSEKRKIKCAKKHFETINVDYKVVSKPEQIITG